MNSNENPIPDVQHPASENTHVVMLTMETPFGLMQVTSPSMRMSEAMMTAADFRQGYVESREPWLSQILKATIQRK